MNPNQGQGPIDPTQQVQTEAYVPTYVIKQPEFTQAVLGAIGKYPFNQIQAVMNAVKVEKIDHNQLTQVMNALGSFPYQDIADLMANVNQFLQMEEPEDDEDEDVEAPGTDALEAAIEGAPEDEAVEQPKA